ncbi:hypothetical protein G9A89_013510 [Geosiphon pyriformis]|nr:hypothetical protein G9A89_013510 [Geosiphon pyriformis]
MSLFYTARPSRLRLAKLAKLTAGIFNRVYNPTNARTGNKILKKHLLGPTLLKWYPQQLIPFQKLREAIPEVNLVDRAEQQRLADNAARRKRGKGPPKKGIRIEKITLIFTIKNYMNNLKLNLPALQVKANVPEWQQPAKKNSPIPRILIGLKKSYEPVYYGEHI